MSVITVTIMTDEIPPIGTSHDEDDTCPAATKDSDLNRVNMEEAEEAHNYRAPNTSIAFTNNESCGTCAFYDTSESMQECIDDDSGETGYCSALFFVCQSKNTCDLWAEEYKDNL